MSPADSAARAGNIPEASGDSSSGTFDKNMTATHALLDKLVELGATLHPAATDPQIDDAEFRLRCVFPEGVREFFRHCNGVGDATADWIWDFFSLERAIKRTAERRAAPALSLQEGGSLPYSTLVCFCDVLIDAPTYLYCADPDEERYGSFFADQGGEGWFVSKSYEDFIQVFIAQNDDILLNAK